MKLCFTNRILQNNYYILPKWSLRSYFTRTHGIGSAPPPKSLYKIIPKKFEFFSSNWKKIDFFKLYKYRKRFQKNSQKITYTTAFHKYGRGRGSPTFKPGEDFLIPLAQTMTIFNKKSQCTRAGLFQSF